MKNWENTGTGRYELYTENKDYEEIAILYDNEIYYSLFGIVYPVGNNL